jgi:hypothetical protein
MADHHNDANMRETLAAMRGAAVEEATAMEEVRQWRLREHSGNTQGTFREHSGNIQLKFKVALTC